MQLKKNISIIIVLFSFTALTPGCNSTDSNLDLLESISSVFQGQNNGESRIVAGLKEALRVGTNQAVRSLSQEGGYAKNPTLRINMPDGLTKFTNTLRTIGLGQQVDLLEQKMNQAAENAAAQAAPVFLGAISRMTFEDARQLLGGNQTAITDYFQEKTLPQLTELYTPIVHKHMNQVGAVNQYNTIASRYQAIPLVPKINFSPDAYVTQQALKGLFTTLAQVERDIRTNPAARTTALLKQVFGGQ